MQNYIGITWHKIAYFFHKLRKDLQQIGVKHEYKNLRLSYAIYSQMTRVIFLKYNSMERLFMARKSKSVYERIEETEQNIASLEQELSQSKAHLIELLNEKDDLEMRQTWSAFKEKGLTFC